MLVLYSVTLALGAVLLFLVQPMFSKMVLPLLGGSPAVWNVAMVFFQATLLAGYLYAHLGHRWLRPKWQAIAHLVLLAAVFAYLPIALDKDIYPPAGGQPAIWLLGVMALSVGLPFFALSATAPMLQSWFAHTGHRDAANPYRLYAVSNFGSILALMAYPIVFEPISTLGQQNLGWALGFVVLALLIAACAWVLTMHYQVQGTDARAAAEMGLSDQIDWRRRAHWVALAFVPSSLLLGVTQHITTDVASAPLFWVIPLILYLGTFVIVFSIRPMISHRAALFLHVPLVITLALLFYWQIRHLSLMLPLHLIVFFFLALVCHGELAKDRPAPSKLTEFYFWMSLGGVLGGAFTALCAPLIFDTIVEYPLAILATCLLRPRRDDGVMTWLKAAPLGILWALLLIPRLAGFVLNEASLGWLLVYLIPVALLTYSLRQRPLLLCLGIAALFVASAHDRRSDEISVSRGFFGVNRILSKDDGKLLVFKHGTTVHGIQLTADDVRNIPLSYYHRDSPIGQVFRAMSPQFKNVGAIGLGIGSVACYRLPGQNWTFFEIDPLVVKIAQNEKYFNYLSDCAPEARIVIGDGRLALAREQPEKYDMLIIDAFSSDAIPMHLMTREALALYFSRLAPGGLILFHISNLHLDLSYVLAALAHDAGVTAFIQNTPGGKNKLTYSSTWVILARSVKDLKPLATDTDGRKWKNLESRSGGPVWTDDFGDIIRTLRVWRKLQRFQLFN